jgi:hypothetical protein
VLDANLSFARQLDRGNAQPATLAVDFNRFDFDFWQVVQAADVRTATRRRKLEHLNAWRNAIAHHDIEDRRADLRPREVTLTACRSWRDALNGLARTFDHVLASHLATLLGSRPW